MEVCISKAFAFFSVNSHSQCDFLMVYFMYHLGPGCSSLGVGAFSENGPFRPDGQILVRNEYSWNRGNMLSMEMILYLAILLRTYGN